jgi:hypothetical protein
MTAAQDLRSFTPESWRCLDCNVNTAPGLPTQSEIDQALIKDSTFRMSLDFQSEVYIVRPKVWEATGLTRGCLCIGCLEKRIGRRLRPKDFRNDPFAGFPASPRLRNRRKDTPLPEVIEALGGANV